MPFLNRLRALFRRDKYEADLDDEVKFHVEMKARENIAAGMPPEEARSAALKSFGNVVRTQEDTRTAWTFPSLESMLQDVRYGFRQLRRNPGFTAVAVLTLALGIGANTAIFSVVNTVLLRRLPYKNPAKLVWVTERFALNHGAATVISPDFAGWKDRNQVFDEIGAFGGGAGSNLTGVGEPVRVSVTNVTAGFFSMLGVQPVAGRTFLPSEEKVGHEHVALLNERLWRSRFGSDAQIVGKTIVLDGTGYMVVGVLSASLRYPEADVWTPLALDAQAFSAQSPRWTILTVIGRLKPGVELGNAQSDLQLIAGQMSAEYPPQAAQFRADMKVEVVPLHELLVQNVRPLLWILLGAVGIVLLIACANVASLLLSRGIARSREMAVRGALGARRLRLIRQILTEALALATGGGSLGFIMGLWATNILKQLIPANLPSEVRLDAVTLAFTLGVAFLAVILFGLAPALMTSSTDVLEALKEGGIHGGIRRGSQRLQGCLVAGEIALSLILLIGAGLLTRTFVELTEVDLGFAPQHLLIATVQRPLNMQFDAREHASFFREVLERVRSLPGVEDASVTTHYPLGSISNATMMLSVQGAERVRLPHLVPITAVSPGFFRTMGISLQKGRPFDEHDAAGAPGVIIVNETLAREVFKGIDPVGKRVSFGPPGAPWQEVVGLVTDAKNYALDQDSLPEIFVPYLQQPSFEMSFLLRTKGNPQDLARAVRGSVLTVDKNQPVSDVQTLDEILANAVAPQRFKMLLLGMFSLLALALATVGIYGVVSYFMSQRTHEIGIRMALGAERNDVLKLVARQGLKLTLSGVGLGIVGGLILTRYLSGMLYVVTPTDPLTFIAVSLLLIAVTLIASYIPARRATRVDPVVALRYE